MSKDGMTTITFNIPKELAKEFKMSCISNDTQMTIVLVDSIKNYIKQGGVNNETN